MSRAGFVLVGGKSSRMGRDKALLPFGDSILAAHVAAAVAEAAGSVALVGDRQADSRLPYPIIPDTCPGSGPLSAIHAALAARRGDWNLIAACDMPEVSGAFLSRLLDVAERAAPDCLIPAGPGGRPEPLCAVYHVRCRDAIARALRRGVRKVMDGLVELNVLLWPVESSGIFRNCNTPEDWERYHGRAHNL